MIRIGVIGCGEVAQFGHLPAIANDGSFELAAVLDPDPQKAAAASAKFGGQPYTNLEDFYNAKLDAVAICSPAPTHFAHVMHAASQRLHVLCEKPISEDMAEAEAMTMAMKSAGKIFLVGFCYRFSPVTSQIKSWLQAGQIGRLCVIRVTYIWNLHGRYRQLESGDWQESPLWRGRMLEGGPMVDCGVHGIDLCRYWAESEIERHTGEGAWISDYDAPDHMWLHLHHHNGVHSSIEMSYSYCHTARDPINYFGYQLIGDGGIIRYERDGYVLECRNGQGIISAPGASEKNFPGMYEAFAQSILRNSDEGIPGGHDGMVATAIARNLTDSLMHHRVRPTA